jgi:hypothetical protein
MRPDINIFLLYGFIDVFLKDHVAGGCGPGKLSGRLSSTKKPGLFKPGFIIKLFFS